MVKKITKKKTEQVEDKGYKAEVDRIFALQKANRWNIAKTTANQRIEKLQKFKQQIEKYADEIRAAVHKDFRKSPHEVDLTEILPVISEIKDAIHHLKSWMRPVRVGTPLSLFPSTSQIIYEPKGLILIISPWNYPFHLIGTPLVAAIAAGNCAIIKASNNTKHTAETTKKLSQKFLTKTKSQWQVPIETRRLLFWKNHLIIFFSQVVHPLGLPLWKRRQRI